MGREIERLAEFVAETTWDTIPSPVREHAKIVLLDTLGVIFAGSEAPEVEGLRPRLARVNGGGATVYARGFPSADPRFAALLNGIAGRSVELCEGHRFVLCQGAVQSVPTLLALCESNGSSGRDALAALILGYEVAARISGAVTARPLAHTNGQWPLLGAVATGARLRAFDARQTSLAIRLGATLMLTPGMMDAVGGATTLNVAGGMSTFAGVLVPDLVLAGFEARPDAIEDAFGYLVGDGFDAHGLTDELGERWEITRNYFRLKACCSPIYSAVEALEELLAELRPAPEQIERIDVETFQRAALMKEPEPQNHFAARYSLPHAAAAVAVHGNAGHRSFTEEAVHDARIVALRRRVHIAENPEMTKAYSRLKPARVTVTLTDGRRASRSCDSARGDFQRPYAREELLGKFRELAELVLQPEGVAAVERLVLCLDRDATVRDLAATARLHGRKGS